ncbi:hypothetical protein HK105_207498 [Polyrhizophydium stewartii]|uniref:Uncharacterized protein n=1 Tax=Polyrhizophydium stewartii TaxID=2732419 RepID=A0ABR4N0H8_9FUNG
MSAAVLRPEDQGGDLPALPQQMQGQDALRGDEGQTEPAVRINLSSRTFSSLEPLFAGRPSSRGLAMRANTLADLRTDGIAAGRLALRRSMPGATPLAMESSLELRIMDAITGEDPMQEGEESLEDQERKRLEEEGRKAALGLTGAQRVMLEDRYNQLKDAFRAKIQEIAAAIQARIHDGLADFKASWAKSSQDGAAIVDILTSEKLARTSHAQMQELRQEAADLTTRREAQLSLLESLLASLETERASLIEAQVARFARQLKNLNYKRPIVIARMLQDECVAINLAIIENRETIHQYIATLRSISIDVDSKMGEYMAVYGSKWNQARYAFVFDKYVAAVREALDLDVRALYTHYQAVFDKNMAQQTALIQLIVGMSIEHVTLPWIRDWRARVDLSVQRQAEAIDGFHAALLKFETDMDANSSSIAQTWLPSLKECDVKSEQELDKIMQDEIKQYRKTSEILAGKRAGMLLALQASRNHSVLDKIAEFIVCLLATKVEYAERMAETELEIVTQLHEISEETETERKNIDKHLVKELNVIRAETRDGSIVKRLAKCQDLLKSIDDCLGESFSHSVGIVRGLQEKIRSIQAAYKDKISVIFRVDSALVEAAHPSTLAAARSDRAQSADVGGNAVGPTSSSTPTTEEIRPSTAHAHRVITAGSGSLPGDLRAESRVMTASSVPATPAPANTRKAMPPASGAGSGAASAQGSNSSGQSASATPHARSAVPTSHTPATASAQSYSPPAATPQAGQYFDQPAGVVREVEFLSRKVSDWRSEQLQQIKARAAQADAEALAARNKKQQARVKHIKAISAAVALKHDLRSSIAAPPDPTPTADQGASPSAVPAFKPKLLDNTEYVPEFKATQFLADAGFAPDLAVTSYIADLPPAQKDPQAQQSRDDGNVVEIPQIATETLLGLRRHLEQAIQQDARDWDATVAVSVSQKLSRKIELMTKQRNQQLVEFEKRRQSMEDLARSRIEALGHLRTSHENEANMLIFKVNKLRGNYAEAIKRLIALSQEFTGTIITPMMSKMERAASANTIYALQAEFEHQLVHHTISLKECLSRATDDFDRGKAVLLKSKLPGHHSAAWLILRESRLIDSDNVSAEMEKWRSAFDNEIEAVQTETANKVHQMAIEFNAYLEDFDFIGRVDHHLTEMRLKFKAEAVRFKASQKTLHEKIARIGEAREQPAAEWNQALRILADCEQVRSEIAVTADYLDCLQPGLTPETLRSPMPTAFEEWKAIKSNRKPSKQPNSRPPSSKTGQRVSMGHVSVMAAEGGSKYRGDDASDARSPREAADSADRDAGPAGHRGGPGTDRNDAIGTSDSANALSSPWHLNNGDRGGVNGSTDGLSGGYEARDESRAGRSSGDGMETEGRAGSAAGRDAQTASRPASGDSKRTRSDAAGSGIARSGSGRKTPGSAGSSRSLVSAQQSNGSDGAAIGASGGDAAAVTGTNSIPATANLASRMLPLRDTVTPMVMALATCMGTATATGMVTVTATATATVMAAIMSIKRHTTPMPLAYFDRKSEKEIRKKDKIPPNSMQFMAMIDGMLRKVVKQADEWRREQIVDFMDTLHEAYKQLGATISFTCAVLLHQMSESLLAAWKEHTTHYARARTNIYRDKDELRRKLKLSLGHPRWTAELARVDASAQHTCVDFRACVSTLEDGCGGALQKLAIEFTEQLEYATALLAALFDGLVMRDEDVRPAEEMFGLEALRPQAFGPQVLETRATPFHAELIASRDNALHKFASETCRRMRLLNEQVQIERAAEEQWLRQWQESVARVRSLG